MANSRARRWMMIVLIGLAVLALAAFGTWRWAVAQGSAATLDRIDGLFARAHPVRLAGEGRYGAGPNRNVELWVPTGTAPRTGWPLVVFVYGGGWHSGDTASYRFVARTLGDRGFATALVGYRLVAQGGRFPVMLQDTAAGVRWTIDHAAAAGADVRRIALAGHSAGAYNVLMLTLDPQWLAAAGVPASRIGGTVSLAGPADFYPFTSDSAVAALGNAPDPALTQPIHFARGDAPPLLLMHGLADDVVRPRNSTALAAAIRRNGGRVVQAEFAGMGHAGIIMALSRPFARAEVLTPFTRFLHEATAPAAPTSVRVQAPVR